MEGAPKIETETTLRVASVNEELISPPLQKTILKKEAPPLARLESKRAVQEEILLLTNKINQLKNYNQSEASWYPEDQSFIPVADQLEFRRQELEQLKNKKQSIGKKIRNLLGF